VSELASLLAELARCRLCRDAPLHGRPLPHEPRPVIQASATARLCIAGQAPGTRVHASGQPFTDRSGERLREWLGIDAATFYDATRVAVVPMGHCFPGQDGKGGDLPPRRECAPQWRTRIMAAMPAVELVVVLGQYARDWHVPEWRGRSLTETVAAWRSILAVERHPRVLPLPHPSWRNNGWLRAHPWFETDLLPVLRAEVTRLLQPADMAERPG
jgi:uracil-DNA glycosylase